MNQPLKSDDRTLQLDTRSGAPNGGLNLDFLDLPDEAAGNATVPATPMATTMVYSVPGSEPPPAPLASAAYQEPQPIAGAQPSAMSNITVFAGGSSADTGAFRILKLFGLFIASFVIVGGGVYLFSGVSSEGDDSAALTTPPTSSTAPAVEEPPPASGEEPSFIDTTIAMVMDMLGLAEEAPPPLPDPVAKKPKEKKEKVAAEAPPADESDAEQPENVDVDVSDPYRIIANALDGDALEAANKSRRNVSVTETQGWAAALANKFPYQHYRAVEEMRTSRPKGAEDLLRTALDDSRLWVRMQAAFALAESGVELTTSEVEQAIGKRERRALLNGYFKRLVRNNNLAERYVMKFALPLVPERARIDILNGLTNAGDPDAELFAIAASFDQSTRVRRWATNWLARNPSALLRMDEYREYLDSWGLTDSFRTSVVAPVPGSGLGRRSVAARPGSDRPIPLPGGEAGPAVVANPGSPAAAAAGRSGDTPVEFYRANN